MKNEFSLIRTRVRLQTYNVPHYESLTAIVQACIISSRSALLFLNWILLTTNCNVRERLKN